jgi:hypothetical protein
MKNSDLPAMPIHKLGSITNVLETVNEGLTKREHFAAMAMQGFISDFENHSSMDLNEMAEWSAGMADALLAALEES